MTKKANPEVIITFAIKSKVFQCFGLSLIFHAKILLSFFRTNCIPLIAIITIKA